MESLAALGVTGLRVGVAVNGLQCPPGILELHLYVFFPPLSSLSVCPPAGGKACRLGAAAASCHKIVPRAS
jgi:hypothetical protein